MGTYGIVLGDLGPTMPVQLTNNGVPFPLVAETDTVTMNYLGPDAVVRSKVLTIAVPSTGSCVASWVPGDLPLVGPYQALVTVVRTGDETFPRTFPNDGSKIIWWIYSSYTATSPAPSPDLTEVAFVVTYTATGTEGTDFEVQLGRTMADTDYGVFDQSAGGTSGDGTQSSGAQVDDLPLASRTFTTFRVVLGQPMAAGDALQFLVLGSVTP